MRLFSYQIDFRKLFPNLGIEGHCGSILRVGDVGSF